MAASPSHLMKGEQRFEIGGPEGRGLIGKTFFFIVQFRFILWRDRSKIKSDSESESEGGDGRKFESGA